jgi:hypothetical protein
VVVAAEAVRAKGRDVDLFPVRAAADEAGLVAALLVKSTVVSKSSDRRRKSSLLATLRPLGPRPLRLDDCARALWCAVVVSLTRLMLGSESESSCSEAILKALDRLAGAPRAGLRGRLRTASRGASGELDSRSTTSMAKTFLDSSD